MARRGFLSGFIRGVERLADRIGNVFGAPPPPPPPPRQLPREEEPPAREPRGTYRGIWRSQRGKGSYKKNLEVFHKLVDPVEPDEAERVDLWETYVRNINRNRKTDAYRRQSIFNPFWQESGIAPDSFDWKKWRIAMGYTGKRRSRS